MQIVRPDMLPLIAGIAILFFFFVGLVLLFFGIKIGKTKKDMTQLILMISFLMISGTAFEQGNLRSSGSDFLVCQIDFKFVLKLFNTT